jgi:heat-inducible transcriptional repressor
MTALTARKGQILKVIINDYVSTAAPVPSNAVARSGLGVSPATVRNDMVALEEDGYILRPHISAGGVPSDKGYRYYVDTFGFHAPVSPDEATLLQSELQAARADFEAWAETASSVLADLLGALAFATTPRSPAATVKGIELLKLKELIVMLVVILQEASVHREIISLDRPMSETELEHARNRISGAIAGKSAREVEAALPSAAGRMERQVLESTVSVLRKHEADALGEPVFQGLKRLFEQPEFTSRPEQARNVVAAVEGAGVFASLASRAADGAGPVVTIGAENREETLRDFSVLVCRYGVPDEAEGTVGLIGPTRMPYERAIPLVRHAAVSLSGIAARVYGA